jgi:hypothetical protein
MCSHKLWHVVAIVFGFEKTQAREDVGTITFPSQSFEIL